MDANLYKATLQQRPNPPNGQPNPASNATIHQGRNGTPVTANGASPLINPSLPNGHVHPGHPNQARPAPPLQGPSNGSQVNGNLSGNPQMSIKGIPQAQMQAHMQGHQRIPPQMSSDSMRVYMEANRVQAEQQRFLQQQQQQQRQQHHPQANGQGSSSSSSSLGSINHLAQNNSAVLANLQATSGIGSPSINSVQNPAGSSASPRMTQPQPLSSGVVPAINTISNQIKARHPQATQEQVTKMATETLNAYRMNQAQAAAAMQAAAGGNVATSTNNSHMNLQLPQQQQQQGMMNGANGNPMQSAQMYAQLIRSQQLSQQSRSGGSLPGGVNGGRPPSRSATPQTHRSGSVQAGSGQSPRPPQAQMAGTQ